MDHLHLWGWYYQGEQGERTARQCYDRLLSHPRAYPFQALYEVALLWAGIDEHWSIGVLLEDNSMNELATQREALERWLAAVGVSLEGTVYRTQIAPLPTVDAVMHHRFGNHNSVVHSFRLGGGMAE